MLKSHSRGRKFVVEFLLTVSTVFFDTDNERCKISRLSKLRDRGATESALGVCIQNVFTMNCSSSEVFDVEGGG